MRTRSNKLLKLLWPPLFALTIQLKNPLLYRRSTCFTSPLPTEDTNAQNAANAAHFLFALKLQRHTVIQSDMPGMSLVKFNLVLTLNQLGYTFFVF